MQRDRWKLELAGLGVVLACMAGFIHQHPVPQPSVRPVRIGKLSVADMLPPRYDTFGPWLADVYANKSGETIWSSRQAQGDAAFAGGDFTQAEAIYLDALRLAEWAREERRVRLKRWISDPDLCEMMWYDGENGGVPVYTTQGSLGRVYYQLGNYQLSVSYSGMAAQAAMGSADAIYHLQHARALISLGEGRAAVPELVHSWYWFEECHFSTSPSFKAGLQEVAELLRSLDEMEMAAIIADELTWTQEKIRAQHPARPFVKKLGG